jgi:SAM-dependent methyltransferase
MSQSIAILGRQPAIGVAELESLYGSDRVQLLGNKAVQVAIDPCLFAFDRLGSTVKFCKLLTVLDAIEWQDIEAFLLQVGPQHAQQMPEGKMQLGLSVIGMNVSTRQLHASGLQLKKAIRATGRSVRLIPNKQKELSSAQVLHNKLTEPNGWELYFIRNGKQTVVAQTVKIQDIEAYGARDQARPKRDARVGMLPPKLAQTIINLGVGAVSDKSLGDICEIPADVEIPRPNLQQTILDPFCGTGVVLQEALLMGYRAQGSDIDERMVEYAAQNLSWLEDTHTIRPEYVVEVGDATTHNWKQFDVIAGETYLGRPFSSTPDHQTLTKVMQDCNLIHEKFLKNVFKQTKSGQRLCIAVPAWQVGRTFKHLKVLDSLGQLGYTRVSFAHARADDLIYHREGQIVGRELVVLERK